MPSPKNTNIPVAEELESLIDEFSKELVRNSCLASRSVRTKKAQAALKELVNGLLEHAINRIDRDLWNIAGRAMAENIVLRKENKELRIMLTGGPMTSSPIAGIKKHNLH